MKDTTNLGVCELLWVVHAAHIQSEERPPAHTLSPRPQRYEAMVLSKITTWGSSESSEMCGVTAPPAPREPCVCSLSSYPPRAIALHIGLSCSPLSSWLHHIHGVLYCTVGHAGLIKITVLLIMRPG